MTEVCPICHRRISDWMRGKTIVVNQHRYHTACLKDTTIGEVQKYDGVDRTAGWVIGIPVPDSDRN